MAVTSGINLLSLVSDVTAIRRLELHEITDTFQYLGLTYLFTYMIFVKVNSSLICYLMLL